VASSSSARQWRAARELGRVGRGLGPFIPSMEWGGGSGGVVRARH
jgi:hypothetical protein